MRTKETSAASLDAWRVSIAVVFILGGGRSRLVLPSHVAPRKHSAKKTSLMLLRLGSAPARYASPLATFVVADARQDSGRSHRRVDAGARLCSAAKYWVRAHSTG